MATHFLATRDFSPDALTQMLSLAREVKGSPDRFSTALKGKALAMLFEKPSLRTRVTFDVGIQQLGGYSLYLSPAEVNLGKRETVADVAHNLERMVQGIMIRTFAHSNVEEMAANSKVPVINGLTDYNHPCQAMADYLTLLELKGKLEGLKLAWVGDGNNVATSLMHAATRFGVHVAVATPPGYEPTAEVTAWTKEHLKDTGAKLTLTHDPAEAVSGADAVYTDVWASMGQEAQAAEKKKIFAPYQVSGALFAKAKPDAVFMHCLPAHRGEEVAAEVMDGPRSVVFQQAENRLHAQKAIMLTLMK